jgi:hypothetical protein
VILKPEQTGTPSKCQNIQRKQAGLFLTSDSHLANSIPLELKLLQLSVPVATALSFDKDLLMPFTAFLFDPKISFPKAGQGQLVFRQNKPLVFSFFFKGKVERNAIGLGR